MLGLMRNNIINFDFRQSRAERDVTYEELIEDFGAIADFITAVAIKTPCPVRTSCVASELRAIVRKMR
jgi:hypothetical protein